MAKDKFDDKMVGWGIVGFLVISAISLVMGALGSKPPNISIPGPGPAGVGGAPTTQSKFSSSCGCSGG